MCRETSAVNAVLWSGRGQGTAGRPVQEDRRLCTWSHGELRPPQPKHEPPAQSCHLHEASRSQQASDLLLSFNTFLARSPWAMGGTMTAFSCLTGSMIAKLLFTSGGGRTGGERRTTMVGSKKELSGNKSLKELTSESQRLIHPEDVYL